MSTNTYKITRFKAFAIHIGISIVIFLCLLILLLGYWYKPPYFNLDDGPQAIRIIIFVDLVLGPLLTLIIFKPGKPGLKFDLALIALFQLSALIYGIWTVQMTRPATVFLSYDSLYVLSYKAIKESGISKDDIDKIIGLEPTYLYINFPKDQPDFTAKAMQAFKESRAIKLLHEYAEPLSFSNEKQLSTIAINMEEYVAASIEWQNILQGFLSAHRLSLDTITFLPIKARRGRYFLVIDNKSGKIIDYLPIPFIEDMGAKARIAPQGK